MSRLLDFTAGPILGQWDSRSVPLGVMAALGVLGLVILAVLYARKQRLKGAVDEQFKGFRAKAVGLMDQLDALRKRHKTLPQTDPDFTAPMAGATLALYEQVDTDLDRLWDRWLKIMEVWDQAQKHLRAGSGLSTTETEEAKKVLQGGDVDELIRESASCKQRLDRLNQGHEEARAGLKEAREELAAFRKSVDGGTGVLLPTDGHGTDIATAESALDEAEALIATDPIGAEEHVARTRRMLETLRKPPETSHPRPRPWEHHRPSPGIDDLAAAAEKFRAAVASLRVTDLLGLFVRAWIVVWVIALMFGLLTPLMPLAIFFAGLVSSASGPCPSGGPRPPGCGSGWGGSGDTKPRLPPRQRGEGRRGALRRSPDVRLGKRDGLTNRAPSPIFALDRSPRTHRAKTQTMSDVAHAISRQITVGISGSLVFPQQSRDTTLPRAQARG